MDMIVNDEDTSLEDENTPYDFGDGVSTGSFLSSDPSTDTNINADDLNAQISREQYQYYKDNFIPVERSMAGQIRDPREIEARSRNAGIRADKAYKSAKGSFDRNAGRFGIGLSADQRKEADKLFNMEGKAGIGGATTRARSDLYDLNTQNRGEFVGLGRGIATGAQAGLSTAAANQAQTDAANQQIDAQQDASMLSTIGTIAMIAML